VSEAQDSWKQVASKAEALGLKLKLHLEQEKDQDNARPEGDTKAVIDEIGQKLSDAFDSVGNAAKDPAVHEDVKDIGSMMKEALMATFSSVGAEVSSRVPGAGDTTSDTTDDVQDLLADIADDDDVDDPGDASDAVQ